MFTNFFISTFRTLKRYRGHTFINGIGLTLGFAGAIFLFWIVRFENSFDDFHANKDRIYRILVKDKFGDTGSHVPQGIIYKLRNNAPEVEKAAIAYQWTPKSIRINNEIFKEDKTFLVHPEMMEMLDVRWISGSPQQSLGKPWQAVLDEKTALRFFGTTDVIGKTIDLLEKNIFTVSGLIRNALPNTEFQFHFLLSQASAKPMWGDYYTEDYWGIGPHSQEGYVLLSKKARRQEVEKQINDFLKPHEAETSYRTAQLEPLSAIHFDTEMNSFNYATPKWLVNSLIYIALFLGLIACMNFINLATVQALQRAKEIGIRKVLGSSRGLLMMQFFGETAVLVLISAVLGYSFALQLLPLSNQVFSTQVSQSAVADTGFWLFWLALSLTVAFLAAIYPALVISSFQPVKVLRGKLVSVGKQRFPLRKTLVVSQFVIAQVLVVCTILALKQMQLFRQKSLGFDKAGIVTVSLPERNEQTRERLRNALLRHSEIKDVTFGLVSPSSNGNWWWDPVLYPTLPKGEATFRLQFADVNYFSFYKVPLVAGRNFVASDTSAFVAIINEKAARDMGFADPAKVVGENVGFWDKKRQIIGVVKDYHSQSLKSEIVPHIFVNRAWNFQQAGIRIDMNQSKLALKILEKEWKAVFPAYYFEYAFLDEELGKFYENERRFSNLITLFAGLAILIGCLGLYGLVSFVCVQRTKEIGIRKVLGASVLQVVNLLSKDFLQLVVLASVIASPIAYLIMNHFLQEYTYRIEISWGIFALAGAVALVIALLTVSFQAVKAAIANPVKSLRTE